MLLLLVQPLCTKYPTTQRHRGDAASTVKTHPTRPSQPHPRVSSTPKSEIYLHASIHKSTTYTPADHRSLSMSPLPPSSARASVSPSASAPVRPSLMSASVSSFVCACHRSGRRHLPRTSLNTKTKTKIRIRPLRDQTRSDITSDTHPRHSLTKRNEPRAPVRT